MSVNTTLLTGAIASIDHAVNALKGMITHQEGVARSDVDYELAKAIDRLETIAAELELRTDL